MFKFLRTSIIPLIPIANFVLLALFALVKAVVSSYREMHSDLNTVYHSNVTVRDPYRGSYKADLRGTGHTGATFLIITFVISLYIAIVTNDVNKVMLSTSMPLLFLFPLLACGIKLAEKTSHDFDMLDKDAKAAYENTEVRQEGVAERWFLNILVLLSFLVAIPLANFLEYRNVIDGFFTMIITTIVLFVGHILPVFLGIGHSLSYILRKNALMHKIVVGGLLVGAFAFILYTIDEGVISASFNYIMRFYGL